MAIDDTKGFTNRSEVQKEKYIWEEKEGIWGGIQRGNSALEANVRKASERS